CSTAAGTATMSKRSRPSIVATTMVAHSARMTLKDRQTKASIDQPRGHLVKAKHTRGICLLTLPEHSKTGCPVCRYCEMMGTSPLGVFTTFSSYAGRSQAPLRAHLPGRMLSQ